MNKKQINRLKQVAKELPVFPVSKETTTMMFAPKYMDHLKKIFDAEGKEVPAEKLIIDGKPLDRKRDAKKVIRVITTENVPVDHYAALKKAYQHGGISGTEVYCREVTQYYLALQRKQREQQRSGEKKEA